MEEKRPTKKDKMKENKKYPYKKNRKKVNPWKVATIVLGIIVLSLMFYGFYSNEKIADIDGFEISEKDLEMFMEKVEPDEKMRICNFETKECRTFSWRQPITKGDVTAFLGGKDLPELE